MNRFFGPIALMTLLLTGCGRQTQTEAFWAYAFVIWNHSTYRVTHQVVKLVGKEIGTVIRYSDVERNYTADGFSNEFPVGTKLYSIVDEDTKKFIAVEQNNGTFVEAVNRKYDTWHDGPPN